MHYRIHLVICVWLLISCFATIMSNSTSIGLGVCLVDLAFGTLVWSLFVQPKGSFYSHAGFVCALGLIFIALVSFAVWALRGGVSESGGMARVFAAAGCVVLVAAWAYLNSLTPAPSVPVEGNAELAAPPPNSVSVTPDGPATAPSYVPYRPPREKRSKSVTFSPLQNTIKTIDANSNRSDKFTMQESVIFAKRARIIGKFEYLAENIERAEKNDILQYTVKELEVMCKDYLGLHEDVEIQKLSGWLASTEKKPVILQQILKECRADEVALRHVSQKHST